MAFKEFWQNLCERVGLAERPALPQAAHVALGDPQQLLPIFSHLAAWGLQRVHLIAAAGLEADDLVQAVQHAAKLGMQVSVRGRASDLMIGTLLADLTAAGVREIEIPFLSAIAEVHDAPVGAGDYRSTLRAMNALAKLNVPLAVQTALTPSTWKTIERTVQLLEDRHVGEVRLFAIACRDNEPSSWAISASELVAAAHWIEQSGPERIKFSWYPPRKFDPARTLAEQVRCGPRAAGDAVRIEHDGCVIPPCGPAVSAGNMLKDDWRRIARDEVFRALKRRREAAVRCAECPGLAVCAGGCLRDLAGWSEG